MAKLGTTVAQLQSTVVALTQSGDSPTQEVIAAGTRLAGDQSVAAIEQRLDTAARSLDQNTVFLQFSGDVTRQTIEPLSKALQSTYGYRVPGEERVASNVREVRFFHADDQALATAVAEKTALLLAQQGFGEIKIATTDLRNWPKMKPRPGTVELWLGQLPEPPR